MDRHMLQRSSKVDTQRSVWYLESAGYCFICDQQSEDDCCNGVSCCLEIKRNRCLSFCNNSFILAIFLYIFFYFK